MNNKVAVVTGASRGIGRATAIALAKSGMNIVVNYLKSDQQAEELIQHINKFSKSIAVKADVADSTQVQSLVEETLKTFGRVDVLINNAGAILRPGDWQNMTDEVWQRTLDINLLVLQCHLQFS